MTLYAWKVPNILGDVQEKKTVEQFSSEIPNKLEQFYVNVYPKNLPTLTDFLNLELSSFDSAFDFDHYQSRR